MKIRNKAQFVDRVLIIAAIPGALGVMGFCAMIYFAKEPFAIEVSRGMDNCKMLIGLWGTLLGFLITAASVLLALHNTGEFVQMLKNTGHFKTILYAYTSASTYLLISIVAAVTIVMFELWSRRIFALLVAMNITNFLSLAFCLLFLFVIILRCDFKK